jgi:hypothetical protein
VQKHHKREQLQAEPAGKTKVPRSAVASKAEEASLHANEPFKVLDNYYSHSDRFVLSSVPSLGSAANSSAGGGYGDPGTDALLRDIGSDALRAGGYTLSEAQERAIRTSIAGLSLGLLVED